MSKAHLATYLNDHLAGANFAIEILDHLMAEAADLKTPLTAIKADIEADRQQLKNFMEGLSVTESRVRQAGTWIGEQLAEVKLEIDDEPSGTLRQLERLEALSIGIEGKIALWRALETAASLNDALRRMDYTQLVQRGEDQRARVERLRLQAAAAALSD